MPEALKKWLNSDRQSDPELYPYGDLNCVNWILGAASLLTGYPREQLMATDVFRIEQLFLIALNEITRGSKDDLTKDDEGNYLPIVIEVEGEDYICHMPSDANQSVGALLEALEAQRVVGLMKKNDANMLPRLCAIYLRKPNETYQQVDVDARAKYFAQHLTYREALNVFFFLQVLSKYYQPNTATSLAQKQVGSQPQSKVLAASTSES